MLILLFLTAAILALWCLAGYTITSNLKLGEPDTIKQIIIFSCLIGPFGFFLIFVNYIFFLLDGAFINIGIKFIEFYKK